MMPKKKENAPVKVRRKSSFKIPAINFRKLFIGFAVFIVAISLIIGTYLLFVNYKVDRYRVNDLRYVKKDDVNQVLGRYFNKNFVSIDTSKIEGELKQKNIFIKEAVVSKSIIGGIVIQIVEHDPRCLVQTTDSRLFLITSQNEKIEVKSEENIPVLDKYYLVSSDIDNINMLDYLKKTIEVHDQLKETIIGDYSFDNFGNLSILLESKKSVRFDLNQRFYTIDEQVSLLQDTLTKKTDFSEIDIRFSYLLIK